MIIIDSSSSIALTRDVDLARGVIYNCSTLMVQATAEIVTYAHKLLSYDFYSTGLCKES